MNSMIFNTGARFVTTNKTTDTVLTPGSVCFMSFVRGSDMDFKNVFHSTCINIKRGKGGKERIDTVNISSPIFNIDDEKSVSLMPDNKRKSYVHIEATPQFPNVDNMAGVEYIGWALSYALFLYKLNSKGKTSIWPEQNDDILNRILNVADNFNHHPDETKERLVTPTNIKKFVTKARTMESTFASLAMDYMVKVSGIEKAAASFLASKELCDSEFVKNTKEKEAMLQTLSRLHSGRTAPK